MSVCLCSHCQLPIRGFAQEKAVGGEVHRFCCYGCCLAYQVRRGEREEPEAVGLLIRLGAGAFLAMNIMLFSLLLYSGTLGPGEGSLLRAVHVLLWVLATAAVIVLGTPFLRSAWEAARRGRANADTLVCLGAGGAYGYSALQVAAGGATVYFDTATMVLVLFTLGRYLEAMGRARAARSLAPVLAAERASAQVVVGGEDRLTPLEGIAPGTLVRVRPGERVPVDGVVVDGRSRCDEAVLTGQPETLAKAPGDSVCAGSVNDTGQLLIRTTVAGTQSRWVRMNRLVREALGRKSLVGELVDRAAGAFVPAVVVLAAGTVAYWSGRGPSDAAVMAGLAVLVVACPCALGLAAPLATALAIGKAAGQNVVIRGGGVFERLARVRTVVFDKTGTLTAAQLEVTGIFADACDEAGLLRRAGSVECGSEHPFARAVVRAARARGIELALASAVEARPGQGVTGTVAGELVAVGNARQMAALDWLIAPALARQARRIEAEGDATAVYVGWGGRARGLLMLQDLLRPETAGLVTDLRDAGLSVRLLSGDSPTRVEAIARRMGLDDWQGGLLPEEKVAALREWSKMHGPAAMVGDGLNDGPVLAAAAVGIAVGSATDLARESADAVLPEAGLVHLPWLARLARRTRRTILVNLGWAFGYNVVALSLAVAGVLQPILAAGLMAGSSLLVVANSLRIERHRDLTLRPIGAPVLERAPAG